MFHRNTEKLESFIGANSSFLGNIETKGTLRIDGRMDGDVSADWVILGEKASLKGNVTARGIIIGGKLEGNLHAKEIVEIKSKGHVMGDIHAAKLTVAEGGLLDGRSSMTKSDSNVVEFQAKGSQG